MIFLCALCVSVVSIFTPSEGLPRIIAWNQEGGSNMVDIGMCK